MVGCREFVRSLCDYLDGALGTTARREFELHREVCPRCWVLLDTTCKTVQLYRRRSVADVPPELERRLIAAVEAHIHATRGR